MALAVETTGTQWHSFNISGDRTITQSFTVTSANLLVVVISTGNGISAGSAGCTWNGTSMTRGASKQDGSNSSVEMYYLTSPASGTHNVVYTGAISSNGDGTMGIVSFTGSDPTQFASSANGITSGSANVSQAITTLKNGSYLVGGISLNGASSTTNISSVGGGATFIGGNTGGQGGASGYKSAPTAGSNSFPFTNPAIGGDIVTLVVEVQQDTRTTFTKTASITVSNAASRLASVVRLATFKRTASITVSNAASRLATVVQFRFHIFTATASVSVSNAVGRMTRLLNSIVFHLKTKSSTPTFTTVNKDNTSFTTINKDSATFTKINKS